MRLRHQHLTWREIDGELVVLDLRSSTYLTANPSGALLMKELVEERTAAELVSTLVDAFAIGVDRARQDVRAFLADLDRTGLLEPT